MLASVVCSASIFVLFVCRYEDILLKLLEPHSFKYELRCSRETFEQIVQDLHPYMVRETTRIKAPVPSHKRVALGLYHYAHGVDWTVTGAKFDLAGPTAFKIVHEFIHAVLVVYSNRIHFPLGGPELEQIIKGFESKRQMPNCCGAIDCSHFLISAPLVGNRRGYYDRSGRMSVILQGVVDSQGRFLDCVAGWPGSVNDKRVFANSTLAKMWKAKQIFQEPVVQIDGCNIKPYLVGDAGYTLAPYCIIPYPGRRLPQDKDLFNFWQSSTRIIVEGAFGRLKGRFRWLNGILNIRNPEMHTRIITVGCILHNLMMDFDDQYDKQWDDGVRLRCGSQINLTANRNIDAKDIRDRLCQYMNRVNSG